MIVPGYYVSVDLGKQKDFTAISVLEEPVWVDEQTRAEYNLAAGGWVSPADLPPPGRMGSVAQMIRARTASGGRPPQPPLAVRHIERLPLGTRYPAIVSRVQAIIARPPVADDCLLLLDASGVGGPVVDEFELRGVQPIAITITGGNTVNLAGERRYNVPKAHLVAALNAVLGGRRLQFPPALPDLPTLLHELENFDITVTEKMRDTYEGRSGVHDDLVLAVAIGVWFRGYYCHHLDAANVDLQATYEAEV